jgi:uncharacterized protein (TIGR02265 family)
MTEELEPVVFSHAVEALHLIALKGRLDENARRQIKEIGIDLDSRLLPSYPLAVYIKSIDIAAGAAYPDCPREEAKFRLGEKFVGAYQETVIGAALFGLLKLMSPERILGQMAKSFRSGTNYTQTSLTRIAPNCADLWMSYVASSLEFTRGILVAGLKVAGVFGVQVEVRAVQGEDATYRVRWET